MSTRHQTPQRSQVHLALRARSRSAGQDEAVLRNMLWLINAHDQLLGFREIATNLQRILAPFRNAIANASDPESEFAPFRGWLSVLDWIVEEEINPDVVDARRSRNPKKRENPIDRHGMLRHPLYSALWHHHDNSRSIKLYASLQWHVLSAHVNWLFRQSQLDLNVGRVVYETYGADDEWKAFPNSPYAATLRLRYLGRMPWSSILGCLNLNEKTWDFVSQLPSVECPVDLQRFKTLWKGWRSELYGFLARALGREEWDERDSASNARRPSGPRRPRRSIAGSAGEPRDPGQRSPSERWLSVTELAGTATAEEIDSFDLPPEELGDEENLYLADQNASAEDARNLAIRSAIAARGQLRHMQMANQLLPWSYDQLSIHEVRNLLLRSEEEWQKLAGQHVWTANCHLQAEAIALVEIMLWTSCSLESAHATRVLTGKQSDPSWESQESCADLLFDIGKSRSTWRVRALLPPYLTDILDVRSEAYALAPFISLPDRADITEVLRTLTKRRRRDPNYTPNPGQFFPSLQPLIDRNERLTAGYFFLNDVETYRQTIEGFLKHESTRRVTIHRISSFLFNRLVSSAGDIMAAVLITGREHHLARTQRFYATYSTDTLERIYVEVVSRTLSEALGKVPQPASRPKGEVEGSQTDYVGARLCAKRTSVIRAVQLLKDEVQNVFAVIDRDQAIEFHNLYTLYTLIFFGYATSMRAIRTPIYC